MQLAKRFSAISEQSAENYNGPQKWKMEIQVLSSLLDDFEVLEESTDNTPGSF